MKPSNDLNQRLVNVVLTRHPDLIEQSALSIRRSAFPRYSLVSKVVFEMPPSHVPSSMPFQHDVFLTLPYLHGYHLIPFRLLYKLASGHPALSMLLAD